MYLKSSHTPNVKGQVMSIISATDMDCVMSKETPPTKEQVLEARKAVGLTQEEAAEIAKLSSFTRWSEYERGVRNMEPARYELFLIKTEQHPNYAPVKQKRAKTEVKTKASPRVVRK